MRLDDDDVEHSVEPRGDDIAYRGTVIQYAPGRRIGRVRSDAGREIDFELEHVVVLPLGATPSLEVGCRMGFDVGWTSRGLRVTKLFPLAEAAQRTGDGAASEGKAGAEGEVAPEELADEDGQGGDVE